MIIDVLLILLNLDAGVLSASSFLIKVIRLWLCWQVGPRMAVVLKKKTNIIVLPAFVTESVSYNIDYVLNDAYIGTVLVTNCDYFRWFELHLPYRPLFGSLSFQFEGSQLVTQVANDQQLGKWEGLPPLTGWCITVSVARHETWDLSMIIFHSKISIQTKVTSRQIY